MGERTTTSGLQWHLHHPYVFTNGKGTDRHAIITAESPYFQFRARSKPGFFWIASTTILNMDSYRRVNEASVGNVGPLTLCLLQDSCKRSAKYRTLIPIRLMLIWPRHLTRSAKTALGESWQNTAASQNSSLSLENFVTACMQGGKTTEKAP